MGAGDVAVSFLCAVLRDVDALATLVIKKRYDPSDHFFSPRRTGELSGHGFDQFPLTTSINVFNGPRRRGTSPTQSNLPCPAPLPQPA